MFDNKVSRLAISTLVSSIIVAVVTFVLGSFAGSVFTIIGIIAVIAGLISVVILVFQYFDGKFS